MRSTATLRIGRGLGLGLAMAACTDRVAVLGPERTAIDTVEIEAAAELNGTRLHVTVTVTNRGTQDRLIHYGGDCNPLVRYYRPGSGTLVWDQLQWRRATNRPCALYLANAHLAPGEAVRLESTLDSRSVLGDSLRSDHYELAVYFAMATPPGESELRLGPVRLTD